MAERRHVEDLHNYRADASRPVLVHGSQPITIRQFVQRARTVATNNSIPWNAIAGLSELAPNRLVKYKSEAKTANLLNIISNKVQSESTNWSLIHWANISGGAPGGDFNNSGVKPDYRASVVQGAAKTSAETTWQKLVSTGEYESKGSTNRGADQMLDCLVEQLCYRPEMREAFAFLRLKSGALRFGSSASTKTFITEEVRATSAKEALIAYVVLVYDSCFNRMPSERFELVPHPTLTVSGTPPASTISSTPPARPSRGRLPRRQTVLATTATATTVTTTSTNPCYRITIGDHDYTFIVTIARHRPGSATFAGFSLDGTYFVKLSWQEDSDECCSERYLYDTSHGESELPGLAILHATWVDTISVPSNPYDTESPGPRCRLVAHVFFCVGANIMFCADVRQSLFVMHDTIDVSRMLALKHVMHRDFSFGNILCNPKYKDRPPPTSSTCAGAADSTSSPSPTCLVIDLDHGKFVKDGSVDGTFEVTGTPLYMSSELLSAGQTCWFKRDIPTLEVLLPSIPLQLRDRFPQMFPKYEQFEGLQAALKDVLDRTADLFKGVDRIQRDKRFTVIHTPRHDLESIFWVFSIFFANALPETADNVPNVALNQFMNAMRTNYRRESNFYDTSNVEEVLNPQLNSLAPILYKIATVLFRIPWCLLPDEPSAHSPDRAAATVTTATSGHINMSTLVHDVVRCMLLTFLFDEDNSGLLGTKLKVGVMRQTRILIEARTG
ncbi:hypothetical protein BKA62DRAFT_759385 [Auriculariales sp. MPI-PUGE-AT-0066]|nr:hypothetical protein BKA62DRAFT_759385 [Auriculariales sp. MPI-PUGE-AT-0066]